MVRHVRAKLYFFSLSHPAQAARFMLDQKAIPYELARVQPGFHPVQLRLAGFKGNTVPALKIDGRRIQGSTEISRALEEMVPEPPLFPREEPARQAVEEAERWGESQVQPVPRRLFRWGLSGQRDLRRWLAATARMPAPGLVSRLNGPMTRAFARSAGADDQRVRQDLQELPGLLDRVDALLAEGTIGGEQRNAADYQIGTSVRVLLGMDDLREAVEGRPCAEHARSILPRTAATVPAFLPPEWLCPLREGEASATAHT
jgi:glutathione S-transferase